MKYQLKDNKMWHSWLLLKNIFLHLFQFSNIVRASMCVCVCAHVVSHFLISVLCFCLSLISFCHSARFFFCEPAPIGCSLSPSHFLPFFSCNKSILDGLVRLYSKRAWMYTGTICCLLLQYTSLSVLLMCIIMRVCLPACLFVRSFVCMPRSLEKSMCALGVHLR